ncbi:uncharacterized protein A4U43_C06F6840 [Asparagus officinalis]|uniref:Uncharacterized protein n=1 Tax=Asparagus officinalis TaxID=4686 RepID=A0A5P1EK60_ASPOF|nr:uncharacterized protein A4U43_C06F6840 [Asparagus officinalis]
MTTLNAINMIKKSPYCVVKAKISSLNPRGFFIEIDGEGGGGSGGGLRGDDVRGGGADHKASDEELRAVGEGGGDLEGAPELFIPRNPPLLPHLHAISVIKIEARPDQHRLHRRLLPHRDDPPPLDPPPTPLHVRSPADRRQQLWSNFWSGSLSLFSGSLSLFQPMYFG